MEFNLEKSLNEILQPHLASSSSEVFVSLTAELAAPIKDIMLRGGKHTRSQLFFNLLESYGINPDEHTNLGAVIEMAHSATLVIDDIEDNSEVRRGQPALHKKFAPDTAINAGVAMHLIPLKLLADPLLIAIYTETLNNIYLGQALDISWHKQLPEHLTQEDYLHMCTLKTGSLISMSARFAAAIASELEKNTEELSRFTRAAGVAFQIKDDVLDITGNQDSTGKTIGQDIIEGKMSLPVIIALRELQKPQVSELLSILKSSKVGAEQIRRAHELLAIVDAPQKALAEAQQLAEAALKELHSSNLSKPTQAVLKKVSDSFINRTK